MGLEVVAGMLGINGEGVSDVEYNNNYKVFFDLKVTDKDIAGSTDGVYLVAKALINGISVMGKRRAELEKRIGIFNKRLERYVNIRHKKKFYLFISGKLSRVDSIIDSTYNALMETYDELGSRRY